MPTSSDATPPNRTALFLHLKWRRLLVLGLTVLGLSLLFHVVAPFLISNALIRDQMEKVVEDWTGNEATIKGTPEFHFWPHARISLADVTIERPGSTGGKQLLAQVGRLSARFDLLDAIIGSPVFTDFNLNNAEIFVTRDPNGRLDWTQTGFLHDAVSHAVSGSGSQSLAAAFDKPVGSVKVRHSAVTVTDSATGNSNRISDINGRVDWPYLSQAASVVGSATIAGKKIDVSIDSTQLLQLFAGRSSNTNGMLKSDLFTGSFNGVVNLAAHGFLSGDAAFSVADMPRLLAWSGRSFPGSDTVKSLSFQAKLITNPDALRFEHLLLSINDTEANGILDLTLPKGAPPRFTGTLALKDVDIVNLLAQITPRLMQEADQASAPNNRFELDLRLSSQSARLGPFLLNEVAMGVMNTGTQARMDILDSDFEGGRLTGRIATTKDGENGGIALRLSAHEADFTDVIARLGLHGPLPAAKASFDLSLDAPRPLTATSWRNAKGSARFVANGGIIPGLSLEGVQRLTATHSYFPLSLAGKGPFEFQSMDVSAEIAGGSAEVRNGQIASTSGTVTLNGIVPYVNNSLALSVTLAPPANGGGDAAPLPFFVGGSWPDPIIWPVRQQKPKAGN